MPIELVILDRDGVINIESPNYIKSPDEWQPLPNSLAAIAKLNRAGIKVALATNQSGVGRQYFTEKTLSNIHDKMKNLLQAEGGYFDTIVYCPHKPDDNCSCRKPKPGLVYKITHQLNISIDRSNCWFIGDAMRDLIAANTSNCQPVLVKTGKGEKTLSELTKNNLKSLVYDDLISAVDDLLHQNSLQP